MDLAHGARQREQTLAGRRGGASQHHDSCGRHFAARGFTSKTRTTQRGPHEVLPATSRRRLMPHRSMSPLLRTPPRRPRRQSPRRPLAPSRSRPRPLASLGIPSTPFAFAAEGVGRSCTLVVTDANRQWPCRHANRVHVRTSTAPVSLLANAHQRREAAVELGRRARPSGHAAATALIRIPPENRRASRDPTASQARSSSPRTGCVAAVAHVRSPARMVAWLAATANLIDRACGASRAGRRIRAGHAIRQHRRGTRRIRRSRSSHRTTRRSCRDVSVGCHRPAGPRCRAAAAAQPTERADGSTGNCLWLVGAPFAGNPDRREGRRARLSTWSSSRVRKPIFWNADGCECGQ